MSMDIMSRRVTVRGITEWCRQVRGGMGFAVRQCVDADVHGMCCVPGLIAPNVVNGGSATRESSPGQTGGCA